MCISVYICVVCVYICVVCVYYQYEALHILDPRIDRSKCTLYGNRRYYSTLANISQIYRVVGLLYIYILLYYVHAYTYVYIYILYLYIHTYIIPPTTTTNTPSNPRKGLCIYVY
jgi:hypothetical protein